MRDLEVLLNRAEDEVEELMSERRENHETITRLEHQVVELKKVISRMMDNNVHLLAELTTIATSRERLMNTLNGPAKWAERTATSLERAQSLPVKPEDNEAYNQFFIKGE